MDAYSLETRPELAQRAIGPETGRIRCPACGAGDDYSFTAELRSSFSWPLFLAGGLLAVLLRNAGRSRKVRCNRCAAMFEIRTPLSRVSGVLFWLVLSPTIVVLIWLLAALLQSILELSR